MKISIIKYNSGNIFSVATSLRRLGVEPLITDDTEEIISSDKIILPGVGEASSAMKYLSEKNLNKVISDIKQPLMGICLGMQLLCEYSEEGDTKCINIFNNVKVQKFAPYNKVPHTGWNKIYNLKEPLFSVLDNNKYVYFVHSYYVDVNEYTIATSYYINEFSAAIRKNNFFGTQFHPEKSGDFGEKILKAFINL